MNNDQKTPRPSGPVIGGNIVSGGNVTIGTTVVIVNGKPIKVVK